MDTTANPTVNRWVVLWSSVAILMCTGSIYAFSVFAGPLGELRGWSMPEVMGAFAVNAAIAPIPLVLGGWVVDRGGARTSILVGGLMFAASFVLTGVATTTTMLYLSYGVLGGLGQGLAYSGCLNNTLKLFPDRRGMAGGLITGGMGAASVIAAPAAQALINGSNVSTAFVTLGNVYAGVILVASFFLRAAPVGYAPAGWTPLPGVGGAVSVAWTGMLRSSAFYFIFAMMVIGAFSGLMIASQASSIGQSMFDLTPAVAALFVSVYAVCNMAGGIVWGAVSDRLGYTNALLMIYSFVALSMLVLVSVSSVPGFAVGIIGLGLCFGGVMGVFPALTMKSFGPRYQGVNYGIVVTGYAFSGFMAPRIAASMGEAHGGDFTIPFLIAIVLAVVGLAITFAFGRRQIAAPVTDEPARTTVGAVA